MASWRLTGVVPDSEDDEDDLDSQTVVGAHDERYGCNLDKIPRELGSNGGQIDTELPRAETNAGYNGFSAILPSEKALSKPHTDSQTSSLHSSPRRLFKDPRTMFDLDSTAGSQSLPNIPSPRSHLDNTAANNIRTSYVDLTSPTPSPRPSPPQSQVRSPARETFEGPSSPGIHSVRPPISPSPAIEDILPTHEPPIDRPVRTFRQRNAIQVHPYVLEHARYRLAFKASGLTPIRLAQLSEEHTKRSRYVSEGPNSREVEAEESQPMEIDQIDPNYVMRPSQGITDESSSESSDESSSDESPINEVIQDIEDLLRLQQALNKSSSEESSSNEESPDINKSLRNPQSLNNKSSSEESSSEESSSDEEMPDINTSLRNQQSLNKSSSEESSSDEEPPVVNKSLRNQQPLNESSRDESSSNEEFPEIGELLRNQQSINRQSELRRKPKQYSSKYKQGQLSKATSQLTQPVRRAQREIDIFDVPASPPKTSSQLLTVTRGSRGSSSRTISHSPGAFDVDEFSSRKVTDPLTPATSVVKPVSHPILIDLVSDEDDPFASEPSASGSSSSDESVELRKISKRIRGVLPASHLRLDQQMRISRSARPTHRKHAIATSGKEPARRGIALPKVNRASRTASPTANLGMPFLSEDSDEGDNGASTTGLIMEDNDSMMPDIFSRQSTGFAEEDDVVDNMLQSRKRRERRTGTQPRKRLRVTGTSFQEFGMDTPQLHTIERIPTSRNHGPSHRRKSRNSKEAPRRSKAVTSRARNLPAPPKLGVLDVLGDDGQYQNETPQFMKVAARAARSKRTYGRQSPSQKSIRLASRGDTRDAQSVLQNWRDGNIRPRDLGHISNENSEASPVAPNLRTTNQQTAPRPPQSQFQDLRQRQLAGPKLRPGQLESPEGELSRRFPTMAFTLRKQALDNVYNLARKDESPQSNFQLRRFLAGGGTPESAVDNESLPRASEPVYNASVPAKVLSKSRKRLPGRMDAGAALYRQPSEPSVLELLAPVEARDRHDEGNKLQGLAKFGTRYTNHFDIFPLQSGIFFHQSTFIGSGRLFEVLIGPSPNPFEPSRTPISYRIGEKTFMWGQWDENVSSEVGECFDWILDQLDQPSLPTMAPSGHNHAVEAATFVVDYVQHHLGFIDLQQLDVMFSRIVIVVGEALGRLEPKGDVVHEPQLQSQIEVISMWAVLIMQLLRISRNQSSHSLITAKLEELLVATARHCIGFLLLKGFESIRDLYDDLQYLSVRAQGIKRDQYAVHSWVMMIKIMEAAHIPRGSFWDVANPPLLDSNTIHMNDAPSMEKIWYSIFTLLPLCEFDEHGVVITGQRQKASFDNWFLPQKMLKGVFALCSSECRQSPGFNDYIRTLVKRCHYLIVEWGWWKCSGILIVLFDCFASQRLRNLRNEEVYKSPQFLEELDTEPSLAVGPDDRCFHVVLKMIALAVNHMCKVDEARNIQNLVCRLLPNHDRQYPKEEPLDARDLASLRNHHDLLCTLHWAASPEYRPSLGLIQQLVTPDQSHNAACLINIRAWQQLARFTFTRCTTTKELQPFITWQTAFWSKLLNQFLEEDANARKQAALLVGQLVTEPALQETVSTNKASTMLLMRSSMDSVGSAIRHSASTVAAMEAFNIHIIKSVFNMKDLEHHDSTQSLIADTIGILRCYMKQIEKFHPRRDVPHQPEAFMSDSDSQESLDRDMCANVDRQMMIFPLHTVVLPCLGKLACQILEGRLYQSKEPRFMQVIIETWTQIVCLVIEESCQLKEFLPGRQNAIFRQRHSMRAKKYWPLFLGELLRYKTTTELEDTGFDIGLEWALILTMPLTEPTYLNSLTLSMFEKRHPLLKPFPNMAEALRSPWLATGWLSRRLIQGVIDITRESSQSSTQALDWSTTTTNVFPKRDFSYLLKQVLNSMERELRAMGPKSPRHMQYLAFCQGIVEDIRSRGGGIIALTNFFVKPSTYYWPEEGDPKLFAASIVSYSLRLDKQTERLSELFHYLYRGWRNDFTHGLLQNHVGYIKKGLKHWPFTEFVLTEFLPAALYVGFNMNFGWILCSNYLPPLADRISKLLKRDDSQAMATFSHLATILKIIMNGCMQQYSRWKKTLKGFHPLHRGIVSVACQFWLALLPAVNEYVDRHPNDSVLTDDVNNALATFARETVWAFCLTSKDSWNVASFNIIQNRRVNDGVRVMVTDCCDNWTLNQTVEAAMRSKSGILSIGGYGASDRNKPAVNLEKLWPPTLHEVLETGRPHFETGLPRQLPVDIQPAATKPRRFLTGFAF